MIFIGIGSSIGKASEIFLKTEIFFKTHQVKVVKKSQNLINPPVGGVAQNEFTNAVWQLEFTETLWEKINWVLLPAHRRTYLKAKKLLRILQAAETAAGRTRHKRWDDRTLDLDILMFHQLIINKKRLTIPHSEIPHRLFVLRPWAELVDKNFEIPKFGRLKNLIQRLES